MQVFKIESRAPYIFGAAIVAARDSEEAIKTYCDNEFRTYIYDNYEFKCDIIVGLDYKTDSPILIFDRINE